MSENKEIKDEGNQGEFATEQEEIDSIKAAQATTESPSPGPAEGETELDALKRQITSLTGDLQRERAEFSNFRKRAQLEKGQQAAQSSARLLTDLLPALDALDQFFSVYGPKAEDDQSLKAIVDGVQLVQKQISRVFTEAGVEEFNPSMMEALSMLEGDTEKETVTQVFQKGYRIEGRVIRAARVVVTKPRAKAEGQA
jgi:molecular chaperone GrpE